MELLVELVLVVDLLQGALEIDIEEAPLLPEADIQSTMAFAAESTTVDLSIDRLSTSLEASSLSSTASGRNL